MSRERSPDRVKAFKLWVKSGRLMKPAEIAEKIGVSAAMVRKWKSIDKWDDKSDPRRGAPSGNKNARGNKGGAPVGNDNAVKHGFFRKFLPDDPELLEIFDAAAEISPLDMLWTQIRIAFTNIIRASKIQHVTNKDEMIKELKKRKFEVVTKGRGKAKEIIPVVTEEEFEFQFAWDRQATALKSQAAAMANLTRMIKQYEDAIRAMPPDEVKEEHRLRMDKLRIEVAALNKDRMPDPVVFKDDLHE
jgi:uncharacterized protein YjcR